MFGLSTSLLLLGCAPDVQVTGDTYLETMNLAEALGAQGTGNWPGEALFFDWTQAVWAFGVHRLYATTGDPSWQDYYRAWMDSALPDYTGAEPDVFYSSDSMSPAILAASLQLEGVDADYGAITAAADLYLDQAPRLANGAIAHWGYDNPWGYETDQVWIDSQFMFGAYLARMAAATGEPSYRDLYLEQYQAFSELCRDETAQLYRHAWDDSDQRNIPVGDVYWARGNSWVLVSAAELLASVPSGSSAWDTLQPLFQQHAEALLATQDEDDGLWHTVLNEPQGDDPDNYTETSASALVAYGFLRGLQSGALEGERWQSSAFEATVGVMDRIDERSDGKLSLEGTSFGTNPGDYEHYVGIEQVDDLMLGYGAAIMLLAEADGLNIPSH